MKRSHPHRSDNQVRDSDIAISIELAVAAVVIAGILRWLLL